MATIGGFTSGYSELAGIRLPDALVLSAASFHGRGLITSAATVSATAAQLSACEGVIGLLVEAALIAIFIKRFLDR